jgi:hypothetical protein
VGKASRRRREDNIENVELDIREIGWDVTDWINLAQYKDE